MHSRPSWYNLKVCTIDLWFSWMAVATRKFERILRCGRCSFVQLSNVNRIFIFLVRQKCDLIGDQIWPRVHYLSSSAFLLSFGPIQEKNYRNTILLQWVVHIHRFVDSKPHVRDVGCHHTWACLWSQRIRGRITLFQKSIWDFLNLYKSKWNLLTILTLNSWFKCIMSKQQKQLVFVRSKSTDIHTTLHAVANCALSNEQTTFSDSLISEHADPCHAHSSQNESMSGDSKIKMNYDEDTYETRMFPPHWINLLQYSTSPFLGWLQSSK